MTISALSIVAQVPRASDEPLDAVACRAEVYGDDSEDLAYLLHWAHMADILDRSFSYSFLARVKVPRLT